MPPIFGFLDIFSERRGRQAIQREEQGQQRGGIFGFLDDLSRYAQYTREALPGAAAKTGTGVRDIAVDAARDTTRLPMQLIVDAGNFITGQDKTIDPTTNRLTQLLFGSEELGGLGSEAERQFGSSSPAAQLGVLAFGALDAVPGGGRLASEVTQRLVKEGSEAGVKKVLKKSAGLTDDVIEQIAPAIARTKD